jgi:V8-like Glu-specific endopeptidase
MTRVLLLALAASCTSTELARSQQTIESPTDAGSIASIVAVVQHDPTCHPAPPSLVCSGTAIAPRVVLTAAHCLESSPPNALDVMTGKTMARVVSGRVHPAFDRETHAHDIAVLFLDGALATTMPLRRAPVADVGATLQIAGYGNMELTQQLGAVTLSAIEPLQLKLSPSPSMTCRGDSGGPLFNDGELVGVTTHGDAACKEHGYAARIDVHLGFIDAAIAEGNAMTKPRRAFDPGEDFCASSCRRDDDCAAGLSCVEGHCSFAGLPPGRFTSSCTSGCPDDAPCVDVGAGCRCLQVCRSNEQVDAGAAPTAVRAAGGGCSHAPANGSWGWLALLLLVRRR